MWRLFEENDCVSVVTRMYQPCQRLTGVPKALQREHPSMHMSYNISNFQVLRDLGAHTGYTDDMIRWRCKDV